MAMSTTTTWTFVIALAAILWPGLETAHGVEASSADDAYACRQDIHPQDDDFPGVHVAALEEAPNGDLLYVFYAGQREKADDVATYLSRLEVGTEDWTAPRVVFDEPDRPDGNAVLWVDDDNDRVHLLFSTIMESEWTEAVLRQMTSDDDGRTWSEPTFVREDWGWLFGTLPFRMSNGEVIVPIYSEVEWSSGWYVSGDDLESVQVYPSEDDTTWPSSLGGMIQPATVELEDGHLLAYNRSRDGAIWQTASTDYGRTWSQAVPTTLPNNNSRLALLELDSDNLLLAYNPNRFTGRSPLTLALSEDGGQTWPYSLDVEDAPGEEFSYPYLLQTGDGLIHLGYTHRRQSMRHVAFTEEFVRTQTSIPSDGSFDIKYEYRDGELADVERCGFVHHAGLSTTGSSPSASGSASPGAPEASEAGPSHPATGGGRAVAVLALVAVAVALRQRSPVRTSL